MAQTEKGIIYPYDYNEVADVPADLKALAESIDALLNDYSLNTDSGNKIVLEMNNTTYKIKAVLKDKDDNVIDTSNEIDLPLENMVTNISYNEQILTLTHQDGHTTEVSIADLISDLASKEEVSELQSQVDDLTTLVETELESNEVEGTEIDVSDSAEYRGRIEVKGNTYQKQLDGNQLIDFSNPSTGQNVSASFENDIFTVTSSTGTYRSCYFIITNLYKENSGKNLRFVYDEIVASVSSGSKVQLNLRKTDNTMQYITLVNSSLVNFSHTISDDTSDIASATLTIYTNNTNTSIDNASISITKPMLQFGTEEKDYEPYCGGQSPNPDYPQEIKVITGDNVVKHCGKNSFDKNNQNWKKYTILDDSGNEIMSYASQYSVSLTKVKPNTNYVLQGTFTISTNNMRIYTYDENKKFISRGNPIGQNSFPYTFLTDSNTHYIGFQVVVGAYTGNDVQLEEGTTPTSYETYREEEYKLDLWKENEFDSENVEKLNAYFSDNEKIIASSNSAKTVVVSCKSNTTYRISKKQSSRFRVGYSSSKLDYSGILDYAKMCDSEKEVIIQTNSTAKYMYIYYYSSSSDTLTEQEILESIQIQEAIELCKIGDYSDILFKNVVGDENYNGELEDGAWYKKGVINKDTFTNLSTGRIVVVTSYIKSGLVGFACDINLTHKLGSFAFEVICTHFAQKYLGPTNDTTDTNSVRNSEGIALHTGNVNQLIISIDSTKIPEGTATAFDNYIRLINPIIAYIKNTPTYTKITDPTLISQLESLRKAKWYKGVNHFWTETENLEPNLKGTYKQSNNLRLQALEQAIVALGGV